MESKYKKPINIIEKLGSEKNENVDEMHCLFRCIQYVHNKLRRIETVLSFSAL